MPSPTLLASIHAYAARDWHAFEAAADGHWERVRRHGGARAALRIGDGLRVHAQVIDPAWPTEADREADLETHQRVAALLARVPDPRPADPVRRPGRSRARGVRRAR